MIMYASAEGEDRSRSEEDGYRDRIRNQVTYFPQLEHEQSEPQLPVQSVSISSCWCCEVKGGVKEGSLCQELTAGGTGASAFALHDD